MAKAQILVVEDDNIVVMELRDRLQRLGYAIAGVASYGEEAIEKAGGERPDLVLMDIRLKGQVDGIEAAEEIRTRFGIPVVYLTAYTDEDTLQRAKVTEPYGYIIKPFQERDLHTGIEVALYKHQAEEEIRRRNRELAALNTIAAVVSQSLNLDEILNAGLDKVLELMHLNVGGIYLADPVRRKLDLIVHRGISKEFAYEVESVSVDERTLEAVMVGGKLGRFILSVNAVMKDPVELKRIVSAMKNEGLSLASSVPVLLQAKEEIVGLMIVASRLPRRFSEAELELLTSIAHQIATAIENVRLFEHTKRRAEELSLLFQAARDTSASLKPAEVMYRLARFMCQAAGATSADVLVLDETGTCATVLAQYIGPEANPSESRPDDGTAYDLTHYPAVLEIVRTGQPVVTHADDPALNPATRQMMAQFGGRSALRLPLLIGGVLRGYVLVWDSRRRHEWDDDTVRLCQTLAGSAAAALENARLFEQAQARSLYLETLQRINATLRSTLPLSQVLETIAQGTGEALNCVGSLILVPDTAGQRLTLGAVWGSRFLDAAVRLTGFEVASFSLPLTSWENPMAQAYLSGELQAWSRAPERIVVGVEPAISPKLAPLIERAMGAKLAACVPLPVGEKMVGVLVVFSPREQLLDEERAMLLGLADQAGLAIENAQLYEAAQQEITERKWAEEELQRSYAKLQRVLEGTVIALVSAIEMKDPYTAGHQRWVAQLACAIAREMGLPEEQIEGLRMAGLIHDIGKISIPTEILSKPGRLTSLEWDMIKAHPQVGYDILKTVEFPWPVAEIVLQHHERLDGSGYPQGLSGEDILSKARILAVADVVVAMAYHRPYRVARGIDRALEEISQNRGVLYDPEVVDACLRLFAEKRFKIE
jgi:putative nucleotidyltransferase with HDIG domain